MLKKSAIVLGSGAGVSVMGTPVVDDRPSTVVSPLRPTRGRAASVLCGMLSVLDSCSAELERAGR